MQTHTVSRTHIPIEHEERKMEISTSSIEPIEIKTTEEQKKPKEEEEKRAESCGLKLRCLAAIFTHGFYFFVFILLISLSHLKLCCFFSWSCAFIHSSFIWIKNLTRSSTYKSQITIDFSALFLCYWAVILFFLFHSIDLIKSDWEKEIPNCENTVWKIPKKTHRAQAKSSDLNMWSKPLEKWARQTCELNNKKNQNNDS